MKNPIGAIRGLGLLGNGKREQVGQDFPSSHSSPTKMIPKSPKERKEDVQHKVNILINDSQIFAQFQRHMHETGNFSNAGAHNLLYSFLEDLELPDLDNSSCTEGSFSNGFGLLHSFRNITGDAMSVTSGASDGTWQNSPRNHVRAHSCPKTPTYVPMASALAEKQPSPLATTPTQSPSISSQENSSPPRNDPLAFPDLPSGLEQPSLALDRDDTLPHNYIQATVIPAETPVTESEPLRQTMDDISIGNAAEAQISDETSPTEETDKIAEADFAEESDSTESDMILETDIQPEDCALSPSIVDESGDTEIDNGAQDMDMAVATNEDFFVSSKDATSDVTSINFKNVAAESEEDIKSDVPFLSDDDVSEDKASDTTSISDEQYTNSSEDTRNNVRDEKCDTVIDAACADEKCDDNDLAEAPLNDENASVSPVTEESKETSEGVDAS